MVTFSLNRLFVSCTVLYDQCSSSSIQCSRLSRTWWRWPLDNSCNHKTKANSRKQPLLKNAEAIINVMQSCCSSVIISPLPILVLSVSFSQFHFSTYHMLSATDGKYLLHFPLFTMKNTERSKIEHNFHAQSIFTFNLTEIHVLILCICMLTRTAISQSNSDKHFFLTMV